MKLYTDYSHTLDQPRSYLAEILKPYVHQTDATLEERERKFGLEPGQFSVCSDPESADVFVLPMSWAYYVESGEVARAEEFIALAKAAGKPAIAFVPGDHGQTVRDLDVYTFRPSGYASIRLPRQHAAPPLVNDPFLELEEPGWKPRTRSSRPTVGFCGQADDQIFRLALKTAMIGWLNLKYHLGLSFEEPETLFPPTYLRNRVLDVCEDSEIVEANFIRRTRYKAGASTAEGKRRVRLDFLQNILDSDYMICVRGTGNFSTRFYECLAMGRVPVFVDTDCVLPFDSHIDWRKHCVWVDQTEVDRLPEKVLEFHEGLDDEAFVAAQKGCRALWEEYLSFGGFCRNFYRHFDTFGAKPGESPVRRS